MRLRVVAAALLLAGCDHPVDETDCVRLVGVNLTVPLLAATRAAVVTQAGIGFTVDPGREHRTFEIPDGEAGKSLATVERVRRRFVEQGLEAALIRKKQARPSRQRALDGRAEARLIALACSTPPDGRKQWTMKLLADKLVELEVIPTVSDETVRRALKKMS